MEQWQDIAEVLQPEHAIEPDHTAMMARRPRARTPLSSSSSTSTSDSMQTSSSREPSSGMRTWTRTVVYTIDGNAVSCLLPDEHHQEFQRRIAIALGHEEIAEIYNVLDRPDDLVAVELQCLLALRSGERRPISFLRLTLLDLEIIEANEILPGIFRRLAKWLPHTTTITSLFRILNIETIFRQHETKTSVWLNNVVIDPKREDPIVIEDGNYVKIYIGDDDQRFQCSEQPDEMMLLQQSAAITAKVGDKQVTQRTRLDCCDREIGTRPRAPRVPVQAEETEPDLRHLHDIWNRPHLQTQGPDREPIMYFDTWFLSALDFPRCSTPRSVALPAHVQLWDNALRQVWRDRQHPHWPIRMQLIFPTPVGAPNGGHLLILQHEHPMEAGILLTVSGGPAQDRFAQLVPSMLPFDRLLWFADQEVRCVQREWVCHATHNHQRLSTNNPWRAENGQHIELHVKVRAEPASSSSHEVSAPQPAVPPAADHPNDSIDDFVFDPMAPVFIPGEVRLDHMPEVIQDLYEEWTRLAFSWQGEEASAEVTTWFVDQHDPAQRVCWQPRNIQLTSQFAMWEHQIRRLWHDRIIDGAPIEFVIVQPRPPRLGRPVAAHVLLVQRPQPELVTNLITGYDLTVPQPGPHWQLALTTHEHIFFEQIIHSLGLTHRCLLAAADRHCRGWYGSQQLIFGRPLQGRDGYSIVIQLTVRQPIVAQPHVAMLQTQMKLLDPKECSDVIEDASSFDDLQASNDATVDSNDHQPPVRLRLATLLPEFEAVKVKAADPTQQLPHFIEIPKDSAEKGVADELKHWGLHSPVFEFGLRGEYLYYNLPDSSRGAGIHYMLCNDDLQDMQGSILHTDAQILNDQEFMRLLHRLGYERAVVLSNEALLPDLHRVRFWNCKPTTQSDGKSERQRTPWPLRSPTDWKPCPLFQVDSWNASIDAEACLVKTPFSKADLHELLSAGKDVLCKDFTGLELPSFIEEALTCTSPGDLEEQWDRWLIFTDGSSQTKNKHFTPEYADAMSMPDTWAMLVLGERYISDSDSEIVPIGWAAHPVRTDPCGSCFAGSTRIGADIAEREGLLWAGLWRLTQNQVTPTVFCVDSKVTGGQADGTVGVADPDMTYRLLRGTFQCLQTGLPEHHLRVHHVKSHAGDPYNEFVDHVAKREAKASHHHPRLRLDLQKWRQIIPSLWLCFGSRFGLPDWNDGLQASAPDLPQSTLQTHLPQKHQTSIAAISCQLSLATMNVQSISKGPVGHSGKLLYLYEQVKAHGINIVGVQEGRNEEVFSTSHDMLRIGAGHCGGLYGVELWINLAQPIGFDKRMRPRHLKVQHFQVCHKDPQRLIVRCQAELLTCWILVAHAPHSGHARSARQQWWEQTDHLIDTYGDGMPWIWLIDANAEAGDWDDTTVFDSDLPTSVNTELFRSCLHRHELCLPSTLPCHTGTRSTWTSPDGVSHHCIDYVVIPRSWRWFCTYSSVIDTIDLGTINDDHNAVGIQMEWTAADTHKKEQKACPQPDWSSYDSRTAVRDKLTTISVCPWHTDVETQARHLAASLHSAMRRSPRAPRIAKKPYITEQLWQWRTSKLRLKKKVQELQKYIRRQALRDILRAWQRSRANIDHGESAEETVTLLCRKIKLLAEYKNYAKKLQQGLRHAKQVHLRESLEAIDAATPASGILRCLRSYIGPTNPKMCKKKTIPLVHNATGTPCTTPEEALSTWVDFFKSMEGGERIPWTVLRQRWRDNLSMQRLTELQLECTDMPTLTDLEIAMRSTSCGKARGADDIPGELLHYFPAEMAMHVFPSLWKLLLHGQEDLSYKGGVLVQAYKGRGAKHLCESFRSLLISSQISKAIHRTIRTSQADIFEKFLQRQQVGGKRRLPVTYGLHQVRAHLRHAHRCGDCAAIVFVDLTEAFYRIFRPLCMTTAISDEALADFLHKLKMPESALHELWQLLDGPNALHMAGLPQHYQKSIAAIHCNTHFWMKEQQDVVETQFGSRPGDPFADVCFSYVWARVLLRLQEYMEHNDLVDQYPVLPQLNLFQTAPTD